MNHREWAVSSKIVDLSHTNVGAVARENSARSEAGNLRRLHRLKPGGFTISAFRNSATARWWALAVLALTQLVVVLDGTIVAIALPQAQQQLGMGDGERQWVITAYTLAFGALLLIGGRIADYWGRKRTFMVGMVGFGIASVWGGLAQTGLELILARGVQGAFAALLAPAALSMVTVLFAHGRERNIAFAIWGLVAGTGAAIGLLLGGLLTEFADWRWCLLVNIFFVAIGLIGGWLLLDESTTEGDNRYDIVGTILITAGLGALVYGFTLAEHGWGSLDTIGFIALGVVLIVGFGWSQTRIAQPLLPLRVILHKVRGGALIVQAITGATMLGAMLYTNFYMQIVLGMSPLWTGVGNVVMTVAIVLMTPVSTKILGRFGPRWLMVAGPAIVAVGLFMFAGVQADGSYWTHALPGFVVMGIGFSGIFVPLQNLALAGVESRDAGVASGVVNSVFHVGGALGLAVFTVAYTSVSSNALGEGATTLVAFTSGYSAAFLIAGVAMLLAALAALALIRGTKEQLLPSVEAVPAGH
ncbi:MFS transporter [Salinibacterium sp. ZJ77]|uniref:MFS transporter n=1 Tax=Salinibacterium sp. ZJ77 TaxID=2708337 RepID=UPI0014248846|nr:MFS transporter [Salinibacterium sp. ZJ77]